MRTLFITRGAPACVDGETEYFNGLEWKPIREYRDGESVLQYELDGSAKLVKPINYIKKETEGLYRLLNDKKTVDQVLSLNHNLVYVSSKGNINKKPLKDVIYSFNQNRYGFRGSFINSFIIDNGFVIEECKLRLMIAISADGNLRGNYWRVRIFKQNKIDRLRMLLRENNVNIDERIYSDGSHNFYIPKEFGIKIFPKEFYKLSEESKNVFRDEIFKWDGSEKYNCYRTTKKENADIAQFILSQFGTRVGIKTDNRIGQTYSKKYTRKSVCYEVHLTSQKYTNIGKKCRKTDPTITTYTKHDGYQYCFTVPSGMLVLRRSNNIFITGNSGKSTWVKENNLEQYTLSPDNIRLMFQSPILDIDGNLGISQKNDAEVWSLLFELLEDRMRRGEFVVVEGTHYKSSLISRYKELVDKYRYRSYVVDFTGVPKEELLRRNAQRDEYKRVPEFVIDKMCAVFEQDTEVSNRFKVLSKVEASQMIGTSLIYDYNQYKKVVVFGDIHGCYEPLKSYFARNPFNKDYAYIFTGDYIDRGLQNKEVLEFLMSIQDEPNVLLLEGNHELWLRLYAENCGAEESVPKEDLDTLKSFVKKGYIKQKVIKDLNKDKIRSKIFKSETMEQIKDIKRKELRNLCRKFGQFAYIQFNGIDYLISHGGIPTIPAIKTSTEELIKGVGLYEDLDTIYSSWLANTSEYNVLIHAHRNLLDLPIKVNDRVYNLCSEVEYGSPLRIVEIEGRTITEVYEPNPVFAERKVVVRPVRKLDKLSSVEIINDLNGCRDVLKKELEDGVVSYNFSNNVFYNRKWNELTCKARGLFIDSETDEIVARSYDKFFNLGEREETKDRVLEHTLSFPVTGYRKENGFLGIVSWHKRMDKLFVASKSTNAGDYAQMVRDEVEKLDQKKLKSWLGEGKITLIFEVINQDKDPHIIPYENNGLVLLDAVHNDFETKFVSYDALVMMAVSLGVPLKKPELLFNDWKTFLSWKIEQEKDDQYAIKHEGWVFEDENRFMVKYKTNFYKFWKRMRSLKEQIQNNKKIVKTFISVDEINVYNLLKTFTNEQLRDMSIIDIQKIYYNL